MFLRWRKLTLAGSRRYLRDLESIKLFHPPQLFNSRTLREHETETSEIPCVLQREFPIAGVHCGRSCWWAEVRGHERRVLNLGNFLWTKLGIVSKWTLAVDGLSRWDHNKQMSIASANMKFNSRKSFLCRNPNSAHRSLFFVIPSTSIANFQILLDDFRSYTTRRRYGVTIRWIGWQPGSGGCKKKVLNDTKKGNNKIRHLRIFPEIF